MHMQVELVEPLRRTIWWVTNKEHHGVRSSIHKGRIGAEIALIKERLVQFNTQLKNLEEKRKLIEDEHLAIKGVNNMLAQGHGRGRLISKATVYDGKVGYFCVTKISDDGVRRNGIIFACSPHDDIVLTDLNMPIDEDGLPI